MALDHPFCDNSFLRRRELHNFSSPNVLYNNFVFFRDFPIIANYFITNIFQ